MSEFEVLIVKVIYEKREEYNKGALFAQAIKKVLTQKQLHDDNPGFIPGQDISHYIVYEIKDFEEKEKT